METIRYVESQGASSTTWVHKFPGTSTATIRPTVSALRPPPSQRWNKPGRSARQQALIMSILETPQVIACRTPIALPAGHFSSLVPRCAWPTAAYPGGNVPAVPSPCPASGHVMIRRRHKGDQSPLWPIGRLCRRTAKPHVEPGIGWPVASTISSSQKGSRIAP